MVSSYKELAKVHLVMQVGSRYYVTSYNAGWICCLSEVIREFLGQENELKSLKKLESEEDGTVLAQLKLDGLLFDHLYTDFRKLVKSKALSKSAFT